MQRNRWLTRVMLIALVDAWLAACSDNKTSTPTTPTPTPAPPTVAQLAGVWTMTETRTALSGGECLEGTLNSTIGSVTPLTMSFNQNGSSLNASGTVQTTGISCSWTGTADVGRFALNMTSCQAAVNQIGIRCSNGAVRDLRIASSGLNAASTSTGYAGTKSDTYNVVVSGTSQVVGTLTINSSIAMTK